MTGTPSKSQVDLVGDGEREADIKMPGSCWVARVAETESPRFSEIPCIKVTEDDTLISTSCIHTNMHTYVP